MIHKVFWSALLAVAVLHGEPSHASDAPRDNLSVKTDERCDGGGEHCDAPRKLDSDSEPVCGNGVVETGEQCDDGNTRDHDGCDANCHIEHLWDCGNAHVAPLDACDADDDGKPGCTSECPIESYEAKALAR